VQENFKPYDGDASFLAGPTPATQALRKEVDDLCHLELEKVRAPVMTVVSCRPCGGHAGITQPCRGMLPLDVAVHPPSRTALFCPA
jgi:hypothetical protein